MDIGNRFSLEDFLAYFFPGVTGALGLYILFRMTSFSRDSPSLAADITTGIIFFVLSYVIGIIFSGFAELAFSKTKGYKGIIPLSDEQKKIIIESFRETFKVSKDAKIEWSKDHFYLCRSIVYERAPGILPLIQRQSSLRQLRINLLPSLLIWLLAGIGWGLQQAQLSPATGVAIIVGSVVIFILVSAITINRAQSNEWREVREVLTAFAACSRKISEKGKTEISKA